MAIVLSIGGYPLVLRASCFGGRARARSLGDAWTVDLEDGAGVGIFLLGDDAEDGTFLARFDGDAIWSVDFYDADFNQLALRDTQNRFEVQLKLEAPGAPIPAPSPPPIPAPSPAPIPAAEAPSGEETSMEAAAGYALWVTVRELEQPPASSANPP